MANENLDKFTTNQLVKRKKLGFSLLVILITVGTIDIAIAIYFLFIGKVINTFLLTPALGCFVIALPIYMGFKKTKEEIARRESQP